MQLDIPDETAPIIKFLMESGIASVRSAIADATEQMRNPGIPPHLRSALSENQAALNEWLVDALKQMERLPVQIRPR